MSSGEQDRSVLEVRGLLANQRNKEIVVNYYINQGMDPDEAREMVLAIYKSNLSTNRKSALGVLIGGGIGTLVFVVIWIAAGRLYYIWLPLCALALAGGLAKFLMASGYEVTDD